MSDATIKFVLLWVWFFATITIWWAIDMAVN